MCLGIPSRVVSVERNLLGMTMGKVTAGGVLREACLDYVPDVAVGDFVMVQMGFAVSKLTKSEADDVLDALEQIMDISELQGESA